MRDSSLRRYDRLTLSPCTHPPSCLRLLCHFCTCRTHHGLRWRRKTANETPIYTQSTTMHPSFGLCFPFISHPFLPASPNLFSSHPFPTLHLHPPCDWLQTSALCNLLPFLSHRCTYTRTHSNQQPSTGRCTKRRDSKRRSQQPSTARDSGAKEGIMRMLRMRLIGTASK